jgi:hypothetical protein
MSAQEQAAESVGSLALLTDFGAVQHAETKVAVATFDILELIGLSPFSARSVVLDTP